MAFVKFVAQIFIIRVVVQRLRSREAQRASGTAPAPPSSPSHPAPRPIGKGPIPSRRSTDPEPNTPLELEPRDWKQAGKRAMKELKQDRVTFIAAGMAYYMFLAVFPALIAGLGIMGLANVETDPIVSSIQSTLPGGIGSTIVEAVEGAGNAKRQASLVATIVGISVALWSASSAFVALQSGLNVAFNIAEDRKFLSSRATAFALLLATGILVSVPSVLFALGEGWVFSVLGWLATVIVVTLLFSIYYYLGPRRETPSWQWVSPGGISGSVIWLASSALFGIYVSNFSNYGNTYGPVSAFIVLILWLYLTSVAILIGGEINAELESQADRVSPA